MATYLKRAIGLRVKATRARKRYTQEKLAEMIDRTVESVSNVERGKTLPTLDTLHRLSQSLDIPLRDFFDEIDDGPQTPEKRRRLEVKLQETARQLSDDDLVIAVGMLDLLAQRQD